MGRTLLHGTRRLLHRELQTLSQEQGVSKLPRVPRTVLPGARFPGRLPHSQWTRPCLGPREREGIVTHVVVLSDSVPRKKFVAVCLNESLVARQNAFGQRSDGKLCGILVANSPVTYRAANDTRFIVGEAETLGECRHCTHTSSKTSGTCRRLRRLRKSISRQRCSVSKCQSRASADTTDTQFAPR